MINNTKTINTSKQYNYYIYPKLFKDKKMIPVWQQDIHKWISSNKEDIKIEVINDPLDAIESAEKILASYKSERKNIFLNFYNFLPRNIDNMINGLYKVHELLVSCDIYNFVKNKEMKERIEKVKKIIKKEIIILNLLRKIHYVGECELEDLPEYLKKEFKKYKK